MTAISTDEALDAFERAARIAQTKGLISTPALASARAHIASIAARCEALEADAARYAWIKARAVTEGRDGGWNGFYRLPFVDGWDDAPGRSFHHATLDAAIDAARTTTEEGK